MSFTNGSTGAASYLWEYGDGMTSTIASVVHTHTYHTVGVFTVSLTAANQYTQVRATRPNFITVSPLPGIYYVDAVIGSDVTGDGSAGAPWRTISHALNLVYNAGSEIRVASGLYDQALGESFPLTMNPEVSLTGAGYTSTVIWGDPAAEVVLFARGSIFSETTSLSGFTISHGESGILVQGRTSSYPSPVIEANWITGNGSGVYLALESYQQEYTNIRGNLISGNEYGIYGNAEQTRAYSYARIDANTIVGNQYDGLFCSTLSSTLDPAYCTQLVTGNQFADNGRDGIRCETGYKGRCHVSMFGNVISGNAGWGFNRIRASNPETPSRPLLVNNFIHGNGSGGVRLDAAAGNDLDLANLVNNTIADNNGFGVIQGLPMIANCIIWGHVDDLDTALDRVSYSDVGEVGYAGVNHNISADPRFVNPSLDDYHLLPTSPAVDVGDSAHPRLPPEDIDGEERVMGFEVDMGADEYRQFVVFLPTITNNHENGPIITGMGRPGRWDWRSRRRLT